MTTLPTTSVNTRKLITGAPLAGVIAAAINAVLFYTGSAMGTIPTDFVFPNTGQPLTIVPVLIFSFMPAIAGGLLLAVLNRFTKRPLRIFTIIALAILAVSFVGPISIPNAPPGLSVILELMHVVVVSVVLTAFNRLVNRPG